MWPFSRDDDSMCCFRVTQCCTAVPLPPQVTGSVGTGGGFSLNLMPSMQLSDCAFEGNTASQAGGGMSVIGLDTSSFSATNLTCV